MDKFLVLFFLLVFPALVGILRSLLRELYLWQTKEYRVDRMISYLRYEKSYARTETLLWFLKTAMLFVGILYLIYPGASYLSFTFILAYIMYFLHLERFLMDLVNKRLVRPKISSPRNIIIGFVVFLTIVVLYGLIIRWFLQFDFNSLDTSSPPGLEFNNILQSFEPTIVDNQVFIPLLSLVAATALISALIIDLTLPVWIFLMVLLTTPFATITRLKKINHAKKIIATRGDNLKIVAITGSYGKTTTKELLYEILKNKFKVAKTPENRNTAVGLSQAIIEQVKPETEVFIVEMGAYKKGEIKESTKVAPPDIAVITALTQQHLSLFGSKENLLDAKYELVEGLKENGTAVFNGNDENCINMASRTSKKKVFFYQLRDTTDELANFSVGKDTPSDKNENLYINKVVDVGEELKITATYQGANYNFKVALKEPRMALNLAAAMEVSLQLGLNMQEVVQSLASISSVNDYLKMVRGINDSTIILDGKTSNLEGFRLALSYLNKKSSGRKWVMTQGIIELGDERTDVYSKLADSIIENTNGLISNDEDLIKAVVNKKNDFKIVRAQDVFDFVNTYKFNIKSGDSVLVEGTFPENILKNIIISGT